MIQTHINISICQCVAKISQKDAYNYYLGKLYNWRLFC